MCLILFHRLQNSFFFKYVTTDKRPSPENTEKKRAWMRERGVFCLIHLICRYASTHTHTHTSSQSFTRWHTIRVLWEVPGWFQVLLAVIRQWWISDSVFLSSLRSSMLLLSHTHERPSWPWQTLAYTNDIGGFTTGMLTLMLGEWIHHGCSNCKNVLNDNN